MSKIKGVFLTDTHMPDNINLQPIFNFIKDFKPNVIVLGGDLIDAKGLHGVEGMRADQIDQSWYERDILLLSDFLDTLYSLVPKAEVIYLEGNHETRYKKIMLKYPKVFKGAYDFIRDAAPKKMDIKWIPYATESSFYKLADTIFIHGDAYPDLHAKKYALDYTPFKVIYGHLHHFQAYTTRASMAAREPRYATTPGCLCKVTPEWKRGAPNQWVNGFISFTVDKNKVIPTVHLLDNNKFYVGDKEYK
jgi:predicted phosphodiesterase